MKVVIGFESLDDLTEKGNWDCEVLVSQILDGSFEINDKVILSFGTCFEYESEEFFILFEFNLDNYTLKLRMYVNEEIELANSCLAVTQSVFQNL